MNFRFPKYAGTFFVDGELSTYQGGICSVVLVIGLFLKVCKYRGNKYNICNNLSPKICRFRIDDCTRVNVLHIGVICFSTDCTSQLMSFL